jgi:biotin transport system permease protein
MAYRSLPALAVAALILAAGALVAGIRPWELLRGGRPVLFLALMFLALRVLEFDRGGAFPFRVNAGGISGGLVQGLSMLISFAGGSLLFAVTTMKDLRNGLGGSGTKTRSPKLHDGKRRARFCGAEGGPDRRRRLRISCPVSGPPFPLSRFGLALSLMLGFLPRFFEVWEETNMACEARCGGGGIRRLLRVIPPVTERMIEKALDTALALEGRGLES